MKHLFGPCFLFLFDYVFSLSVLTFQPDPQSCADPTDQSKLVVCLVYKYCYLGATVIWMINYDKAKYCACVTIFVINHLAATVVYEIGIYNKFITNKSLNYK